MTKPKYKIGDRVTVGLLDAEITKVEPLELSEGYLYLVRFVRMPGMLTLVTESEINDQTKI